MSMQPYMMILGDIIVPITPGKITTKYKGKNKIVELVDGGVINKLNPPGLVNYSFTLVLPKKTICPLQIKFIIHKAVCMLNIMSRTLYP